jgi:8-oxoguanine deaminase
MWLAAGTCPVVDFEAAGAAVGLGVDGSTSNDSSNMMEAVRHSLMLQRLRYGPRVTPLDALRWATAGGAACLGRDDIGRIAVGKQADLALFKLDAPRFFAALVLCGAHRADRVMVDGVWRVIDGAVVGLDLEGLLAEHRAASLKFA